PVTPGQGDEVLLLAVVLGAQLGQRVLGDRQRLQQGAVVRERGRGPVRVLDGEQGTVGRARLGQGTGDLGGLAVLVDVRPGHGVPNHPTPAYGTYEITHGRLSVTGGTRHNGPGDSSRSRRTQRDRPGRGQPPGIGHGGARRAAGRRPGRRGEDAAGGRRG